MQQRVITLPALDRQVTLGSYVAAVKTAKANPKARFKSGLTCWWSCTGAEIMRQFMDGLHDRINQAVPFHLRGTPDAPAPKVPRGRKWDPDWHRAARHTQNRVNTPRLIVRACEVMPDLRARLAHRITTEEDL